MTSTMERTRKMYAVIGPSVERFPQNQLPTCGQILARLMYLKEANASKHAPSKTKDMVGQVLDEIYELWEKANIPHVQKKNGREKALKIWKKYLTLTSKNKGRDETMETQKLKQMKEECDTLFDLATPKAIELIRGDRLLSTEEKERDVMFYLDQKGNRTGKMSSRDKQYVRKVTGKRLKMDRSQNKAAQQNPFEGSSKTETGKPDDSEVEDDEEANTFSDGEFEVDPKQRKQLILNRKTVTVSLPQKILQSPAICQMADRQRLTSSQVIGMVSAVITSAGPPVNLNQFTLSEATARRERRRGRAEVSQQIRDSFVPPKHIVVHWDGKVLQDTLGLPEHRHAILMSGAGYEAGKLLSVPVIANATGLQQAQATLEALEEWSITELVRGLCFDTTSSNTGRLQGAMVRLESYLGRRVFRLACRHHIYELVVGSVATCLFGATTGPSLKLFDKLKASWPSLDLNRPVTHLSLESPWERQQRDAAVRSLRSSLTQQHPREDYRECAELALALLGETPPHGLRWQRPGAVHNARWMAKVLYCAKLFLLQEQLNHDPALNQALTRMAKFLALLYVPAWLNAPQVADAAANDAQIINQLQAYKRVDDDVAKAALKKLKRHTWYLAPETVVFAMCSGRVSSEVKGAMAERLLATSRPEEHVVGGNSSVVLDDDESVNLPDFIDEDSWLVFSVLNHKGEWLKNAPEEWDSSKEYEELCKFVSALKVTNDTAERGVQMVQQFAGTITKNETDLQWLLQSVEAHRKKFPKFTKSAMSTL